MPEPLLYLHQLPKANPAIITGFSNADKTLELRLREIGFAEGDKVELLHRGLLGGNPISIRLNDGALIALRKCDAAAVMIKSFTSDDAPTPITQSAQIL